MSRKRPTTTQISIVEVDEQTEGEPKYSTTVESVNSQFTFTPDTTTISTTTRLYGSVSQHRRTTTTTTIEPPLSTTQSSSSFSYPSTTSTTETTISNNDYTNTPSDYSHIITTTSTSPQSNDQFSTVQSRTTLSPSIVFNSDRNQNRVDNLNNPNSFDVITTTDNSLSVGSIGSTYTSTLDNQLKTDTLTQTNYQQKRKLFQNSPLHPYKQTLIN